MLLRWPRISWFLAYRAPWISINLINQTISNCGNAFRYLQPRVLLVNYVREKKMGTLRELSVISGSAERSKCKRYNIWLNVRLFKNVYLEPSGIKCCLIIFRIQFVSERQLIILFTWLPLVNCSWIYHTSEESRLKATFPNFHLHSEAHNSASFCSCRWGRTLTWNI